MKTILITGASSGIGKATALRFQSEGWNVIATMRDPPPGRTWRVLDNVLVTQLDVTDAVSIASAVSEGIARFGRIDALLNNAGYGAYGPLEAFSTERIHRQFDTNVIGLLEVTKAVLPHMRANRAGTIVNISSIGGQITFPLGTLYHGTKFAVEGLSEALHYELEPLGIRVRIVQPGMIGQTSAAGPSTSRWMRRSRTTPRPPRPWGGCSEGWPRTRQPPRSSPRSSGRPLTRPGTACASAPGRMPRTCSTTERPRTTRRSSAGSRPLWGTDATATISR
jgi:NAD(P)-dependent dehydrogenase (short-subunit alcohol dehydrogenase family)